ncbi:hypothetical protein GD416_26490 [Burkholderia sp. BE24]|nr:hypothetical protein [Burkholderia sp. BE24]
MCRRSRTEEAKRYARCVDHVRAAAPGGFGGQSHSTGYDGGSRAGKCVPGAVVDWRHSTNSRRFACFFFFSRFDKP